MRPPKTSLMLSRNLRTTKKAAEYVRTISNMEKYLPRFDVHIYSTKPALLSGKNIKHFAHYAGNPFEK